MADTKDIILNVTVSNKEAITKVAELQKQLDKLKIAQYQVNAAVKTGTKTREEADRELVAIKASIADVNSQMRAYNKEIQNNIAIERQQDGSLNQLRTELKNLTASYAELSQQQRDSSAGQEQLKNIAELTDKVKKLEAAQGDFRRNVGNYASAFDASTESLGRFGTILSKVFGGNMGKIGSVMSSLTGTMKTLSTESSNTSKSLESTADSAVNAGKSVTSASKGFSSITSAMKSGITVVGNLSKAFLKLLANPFVAVFTAIALVVMKLVEAIKKNDAAMTALERAFSVFKPIGDVISALFNTLSNIVGKAADAFANFAQAILSHIPILNKYAKAEDDIVVATDRLQEAQRKATEQEAANNLEIAKLRDKSVQKDKYSFEQRKSFLTQAIELEKSNLKTRKDNAKEELRIAERKALAEIGYTRMTAKAWNELSDDVKDNITQLRANVYNAETEFYNSTKRMRSQISTFEESDRKEREDKAKAHSERIKRIRENEYNEYIALEDMYINSIRDLRDKELAQTKASYERMVKELKDRLKNEEDLSVTARKRINERITLLEAEYQSKALEISRKHDEKKYGESINRIREYYNTLFGSLSDDEAKVQIQVELRKIEAETMKRQLESQTRDIQSQIDSLSVDISSLMGDEEKYADIANRYSYIFGVRGYKEAVENAGQLSKALDWLMTQYISEKDYLSEYIANMITAIDNAYQKETERLVLQNKQKQYDEQQKLTETQYLTTLEYELNALYGNELEKSRIVEEQARRRLGIAMENSRRIASLSEDEAVAIYGNYTQWQQAIANSNLEVAKSQTSLDNAIRNTQSLLDGERKRMTETAISIASAVGSIASSFSELFNTMAENDSKYSDFATAMAMANILISTAVSIANAIQGATAAGAATGVAAPLTTPLFITELVGIVASGIASAVSTLQKAKSSRESAPKFASGGLVGGRTAKTRQEGVKDDISAYLSVGEYVIPADKAKMYLPVLDAIRGSGMVPVRPNLSQGGIVTSNIAYNTYVNERNLEQMRDVFASAVKEIEPVVSVREITRVQNRVKAKEGSR